MSGKFFQALLFRRQKIPPHLLEKPYIHWHLLKTKLAKILGNSEFFQAKLSLQQEFQGMKGKNIFHGARLENFTSAKSFKHSRTLVVHPLTFSGGFFEGKTCQGSFSRHYYSDDRKFHPIF